MTNPDTLPIKTFYVGVRVTDYKKAHIEASAPEEAEAIAEDSLTGVRDDIYWSSFDGDYGVGDIEECD